MDHLCTKALEIIKSNLYITLATSHEDRPWSTPVYSVHDKELNFFWASWTNAQHSKNICENDDIFFVIYDSTRKLGTNHQECLYIQAKGEQVSSSNDVQSAITLFNYQGKNFTLEEFTGSSVKRIYKAVPKKVWLNDLAESQVTEKTVEMRVEIPLDKLKRMLMHQ